MECPLNRRVNASPCLSAFVLLAALSLSACKSDSSKGVDEPVAVASSSSSSSAAMISSSLSQLSSSVGTSESAAINSSSSAASSSSVAAVTISLQGIVRLADGTPVNNATVYIDQTTSSPNKVTLLNKTTLATQLACQAPPVTTEWVTCTDDNGAFTLSGLPPANYVIEVLRGAFSTSVAVDANNANDLVTLADITLTGGNSNQAVEIALVTGDYDFMENLLAKTGFGDVDEFGQLILGTETFAIYDGNESLIGQYPAFSELFEVSSVTGKANIFNFDVVFLNCGIYEYADFTIFPDDPDLITVLQTYVAEGGRLYATDQAYDYIEQAFPDYINFYNDPELASQPGLQNDAEYGTPENIPNAQVLDQGLATFLANAECAGFSNGCLNDDGSLYIEGFLDGWAIMMGAHEGSDKPVKFYSQGPVARYEDFDSIEASIDMGVRPLTVSFEYGNGYVFYSSYHTEDTGSPGFLPQDRVLQYLIFE